MDYPDNFIKSALFEFNRYKSMGDSTFVQLNDKDIHWKLNESDNSIALIVKHISGNMLSRWTNFLTEDGEKPWRNREDEFTNPYETKTEMLAGWEEGWRCLFKALNSVTSDNFDTTIKIRNESHTIVEAVHRQLAHYSSHIGQIVLLGKMIKAENWTALSIPKGTSEDFNKNMFKK
ncbi:DUF1572 family protein [Zobellia barbeyronii]|uniref:DUF1572 family protein n=1 Tax=Zobellia barbeyronii TaxID=2748009 RepID=A0ABS5WE64_9FLAO|nr:DUF1572 family protein [Zobellia barbeyronii]MBT2161689.1 DUF1572 family protein [Zobellia barbeyronii]